MWTVAGGIILALVIIGVILDPGPLIMVSLTLVIGLAVVAGLIFVGKDAAVLVIVCFFIGWLLFVVALLIAIIRDTVKKAGGFNILISGFFLKLRPAFTERQKVQKIALRELHSKKARELVELRQADERQQAHRNMVRQVRQLEKKFQKFAQLHFHYSPNSIDVFTRHRAINSPAMVCRMTALSLRSYELELNSWLFLEQGQIFRSAKQMVRAMRKVLRRVVADDFAVEVGSAKMA